MFESYILLSMSRDTWETRTGTHWWGWRSRTYFTCCPVAGTGNCVSGGETTATGMCLTALRTALNPLISTTATVTPLSLNLPTDCNHKPSSLQLSLSSLLSFIYLVFLLFGNEIWSFKFKFLLAVLTMTMCTICMYLLFKNIIYFLCKQFPPILKST